MLHQSPNMSRGLGGEREDLVGVLHVAIRDVEKCKRHALVLVALQQENSSPWSPWKTARFIYKIRDAGRDLWSHYVDDSVV